LKKYGKMIKGVDRKGDGVVDLEDNLMTIMAQLPKIDGREPQPHEVFDMIAGTSTGG
jgi:patatin-like phospholipase/acyl hydrolase